MAMEGTGGVQASVVVDASQIDSPVQKLRDAIKDIEAGFLALQGRFESGGLSVMEYAQKCTVLFNEQKKLETALRGFEKQAAAAEAATLKAAAASERLALANANASASSHMASGPSANPAANVVSSTYDIVGEGDYVVEQAHRTSAANEEAATSYRRLITDINATATANKTYVASANAASVATAGITTAQTAVSPRTMAATRAITDFSRAAEDFSTGGFLGVMNNIPGVMMNTGQALQVAAAKLALWTAGVSIAVAAGYLLYKNWDSITGLFETRNPFPKTTDSIEGMTEAIKTNEKALDALRKKESLNNSELEKANKLLKENVELELRRKSAKEAKEFREAPSEEAENNAKAFEEAFKGKGQEVGKALEEAFKVENAERFKTQLEELGKLREKAEKAQAIVTNRENAPGMQVATDDERKRASDAWKAWNDRKKQLDAEKKATDPKQQADLLIGDVKQKKVGAYDRFGNLMKKAGADFTPELRKGLEDVDPKRVAEKKRIHDLNQMEKEGNEAAEKVIDEDIKASLNAFGEASRDEDAHPRMKKPKNDEIERDRKKFENEQEQQGKELDREALKRAKKVAPGIDKEAKDRIIEGRAMGGDADTIAHLIQADIAEALKRQGLTDDEAKRGAKQIGEKAAEDVQEDITQRRLKLEDAVPKRQKGSEVFGIEDLSNKIQSGVGADERADRKKMLNLNEQMLNALARQIPMLIDRKLKGVPQLGVK